MTKEEFEAKNEKLIQDRWNSAYTDYNFHNEKYYETLALGESDLAYYHEKERYAMANLMDGILSTYCLLTGNDYDYISYQWHFAYDIKKED